MTARLHYGATAKICHWLIVGLLAAQYPIGWLMPDIHRGVKPGAAMTFHVSFGMVVLVLIVLRFAWRLAHPVAPEGSLRPWQRLSSEAVHWLLYALVLATTVTGWLFASFRGWSMSFFFLAPMPMLASNNPAAGKVIDTAPGVGTDVDRGSKVVLIVSSGPAQVAVPNVVGATARPPSSCGAAAVSVVLEPRQSIAKTVVWF